MSKRVDETKAGQAISAFVIINPENKLIARVQAHYSPAGRVIVNVWNWGKGGEDSAYQEGSASGYGYDKFTAAISHMIIDGHELTNHCAVSLPKPEGLSLFPHDFKAPAGYHLANWTEQGYADCYKESGLDYLRSLGYSVIQAI